MADLYNCNPQSIKISKENAYIVRADTKRFGENEIMYQGTSYGNCLDYISRELVRTLPEFSFYVIPDFPRTIAQGFMAEEQRDKYMDKVGEVNGEPFTGIKRYESLADAIDAFKIGSELYMNKYKDDLVINNNDSSNLHPVPISAFGIAIKYQNVDKDWHIHSGEVDLLYFDPDTQKFGFNMDFDRCGYSSYENIVPILQMVYKELDIAYIHDKVPVSLNETYKYVESDLQKKWLYPTTLDVKKEYTMNKEKYDLWRDRNGKWANIPITSQKLKKEYPVLHHAIGQLVKEKEALNKARRDIER